MRAKKIPPARDRASRLQAIRWTVELAASEFGINPRTLASKIRTHSIEKGNDGKFSTADICRAIFDDYERERTRKLKEEADGQALENAAARGQLVDKIDLLKRYQIVWANMRAKILNSSMSAGENDALMNDLAELHTPS